MKSEVVLARIEALPDESRQLVLALVDILAKKGDEGSRVKPEHALKFDWEGGLGEPYGGFTSLDLQHRANRWR